MEKLSDRVRIDPCRSIGCGRGKQSLRRRHDVLPRRIDVLHFRGNVFLPAITNYSHVSIWPLVVNSANVRFVHPTFQRTSCTRFIYLSLGCIVPRRTKTWKTVENLSCTDFDLLARSLRLHRLYSYVKYLRRLAIVLR